MDQLYDSLEALNIDISAEDDLLPELPEEGPAAEEIAGMEEEELVDRGGAGSSGAPSASAAAKMASA